MYKTIKVPEAECMASAPLPGVSNSGSICGSSCSYAWTAAGEQQLHDTWLILGPRTAVSAVSPFRIQPGMPHVCEVKGC